MIYELKPYQEEHLNDYVALFVKVFEKEPWNDQWHSLEHAKAYLSDIINTPGFRGYVVYHKNQVVGLCLGYLMKWWRGNEYYIKEFFIDDTLQNQGIGSHYIIQSLKLENVQNITLLTEKNVPAYQFYKKQGLQENPESVFMFQKVK